MYKVHTTYVTIGFCNIRVSLTIGSVVRYPNRKIFEILGLKILKPVEFASNCSDQNGIVNFTCKKRFHHQRKLNFNLRRQKLIYIYRVEQKSLGIRGNILIILTQYLYILTV